jgi:CotS family spore coat protein
MSIDTEVSLKSPIGHKEIESIMKALKHYEIKPDNIEKIQSAYKITCGGNCYCLKRVQHGDKRALKGIRLFNYLKSNGFDNVAEYIVLKNGEECVKIGNTKYYLTEWIQGKECDVNDFSEVKRSVVLLANFHLKSRGFYDKHAGIKSKMKNWVGKLESEKMKLDIFKNIIEGKKIRTTFDSRYYQSLDRFKQRMDAAVELLKHSHYSNLSQNALLEKTICHGNFNYHNILAGNDGKIYITDLNNVVYGINAYDLAKFVGRLLHKKAYYWNFSAARDLIEAYNEVRPLSIEELEVLLAFLIFPHKFWKLGKKRYEKKKKWDEDKYLKKLDKIINCFECQTEFIDSFIKYFSITVEI